MNPWLFPFRRFLPKPPIVQAVNIKVLEPPMPASEVDDCLAALKRIGTDLSEARQAKAKATADVERLELAERAQQARMDVLTGPIFDSLEPSLDAAMTRALSEAPDISNALAGFREVSTAKAPVQTEGAANVRDAA